MTLVEMYSESVIIMIIGGTRADLVICSALDVVWLLPTHP